MAFRGKYHSWLCIKSSVPQMESARTRRNTLRDQKDLSSNTKALVTEDPLGSYTQDPECQAYPRILSN